MSSAILCIGELLWDALPSGLFLGGAPFNVSCHLNELNEEVSFASRVGKDRLGYEALRRISSRDIKTNLIQEDNQHESGFVEVQLDAPGDPEYHIIEPVAWDFISPNTDLKEEAANSWGIVFGSLAQRNEHSRQTIQELFNTSALKIFDINLREPYCYYEIVLESVRAADVLKFNIEELSYLIDWFELKKEPYQAIEELSIKYECETVCMTRGANGAVLYHKGQWSEHPGYRIEMADAVGAGDAFLAALVSGLHQNLNSDELLVEANATGAYVASQVGANPHYTKRDIHEIRNHAIENEF